MSYLIIDIETVARVDLNDTHWPQWSEKHPGQGAALFPEFARIAVIGAIVVDEGLNIVRERGFAAPTEADEASILEELRPRLNQRDLVIVGHNIKCFDIPFLAARYLANKLAIPDALRVMGKKPWEVPHIDTMELLKFGGNRSMSLESAALLLGLPSPKSVMRGGTVDQAIAEGRLDDVVEYCLQQDCKTTLEIFKILYNL